MNANMTVKEACELLRCNGVELAEKLGVTPPAVYQWKKIPLARIYQIMDLAKGKEPIRKPQAA